MTEVGWLACTNPDQMLDSLRGKVARKRRLFACACTRQVWGLLTDDRSRRAVLIAERYADGHASRKELVIAWESAWAATQPVPSEDGWTANDLAARAAVATASTSAEHAARTTFVMGRGAQVYENPAAGFQVAERRACAVLRDIFGNPFRPAVALPSWLAWNDGTVGKIAQRIYDEQDIGVFPILADALTDAGCDNEDILRHCREPGEHVRGCWVVDLLLGKA